MEGREVPRGAERGIQAPSSLGDLRSTDAGFERDKLLTHRFKADSVREPF